MAESVGNTSTQAIAVQAGAPPDADLIFMSINNVGSDGRLNASVRRQLDLRDKFPDSDELDDGYTIRQSSKGLLCYVVTVDGRPTEVALRTNMSRALADPRLADARTWWVPLMGTGAGGLSYWDSFNVTFELLAATTSISKGRSSAVIAIPEDVDRIERGKMILRANAASQRIAQQSGPVMAEGDPYSLPLSEPVKAALAFATTLAALPGDKRRSLSTTLLFFALAQSESEAAPPALRADRTAECFAGAVRFLAGERYDEAWKDYFMTPDRPREPGETVAVLLRPTPNIAQVIRKAGALAEGPGQEIGIDHLIKALMTHDDGRVRNVLASMAIEPVRLLSEYDDARVGAVSTKVENDVVNSEDRLGYGRYATAIHAFLTHRDTAPPLSISIQAPWGGGKSTLMHLVREKLDPKDEREKHKNASENLLLGMVVRWLDQPVPRTGRTASEPNRRWESARRRLRAGWRSLKNGLMTGRAKPELDSDAPADGRRWTIWFNAWRYETTEQVWAGLVDAIVSQVADRLPPLRREKFLLRLHLARIDDGIIRKRIYDRVLNVWWAKVRAWTLFGFSATLTLFGLGAAKEGLPGPIQEALALWQGGSASAYSSAIAAPIILSIYLVGSYFWSRRATRREPATFSLADVIRVPDYDKGVGELHQIQADLRRVLDVVPVPAESTEPAPLVVFIDDLDRCSPGRVANVVEGVSMLLANTDHRCMFVIGMDPQMVAAALEKAHEDVKEKLPSYEQAVPLGWRFMDKFVQLPFTIPPSVDREFGRYVDWLADGPGRVASVPPPVREDKPVPTPASDIGSAWTPDSAAAPTPAPVAVVHVPTASEDFAESRDVGAIIRMIAGNSVSNPREMKRMVNLARFYLTLRRARREDEPGWRAPELEQYAQWIVLTLRWPDMMRWLQWGSDEADWSLSSVEEPLVARRLRRLEEHALACDARPLWSEALNEKLKVPIGGCSDWACDFRLFEFFRSVSRAPPGLRLSDAARTGFW
jgi:hypothetical protein